MSKESPFLQFRAGREYQAICADALLWLQYVTLFGLNKERASDLYIRKGFFSWGKKKLNGLMGKLFNRDKPSDRPEEPEDFDKWLFDYLERDWNQAFSEMEKGGSFLGYLSGYLSGELKLDNNRVKQMSIEDYDKALEYKLGVGLSEIDKLDNRLDSAKVRSHALAYSQREGARWVAIYDENGERAGRPYEILSKMYRDMVTESIETGETLEQLQSKMVYPDLIKLVEEGKISLDDYLEITDGQEKDMLNQRLNRDFCRFAWTESSYAFNNGRILALTEAGIQYAEFTRGAVTL